MAKSTVRTPSAGVDPRILRTRRALRDAISELVAERPLAEITVADIAGRAGVNRATIYAHYQDRDEILLDALEEQIAGIIEQAAACEIGSPPDDPDIAPAHLVRLFEHLGRHDNLFGPLLGPTGSARLITGIRSRLAAAWCLQLQVRPTRPGPARVPVERHATFLSGALLGVIQDWLAVPAPDRESAPVVAADTWILLRATVAGN